MKRFVLAALPLCFRAMAFAAQPASIEGFDYVKTVGGITFTGLVLYTTHVRTAPKRNPLPVVEQPADLLPESV